MLLVWPIAVKTATSWTVDNGLQHRGLWKSNSSSLTRAEANNAGSRDAQFCWDLSAASFFSWERPSRDGSEDVFQNVETPVWWSYLDILDYEDSAALKDFLAVLSVHSQCRPPPELRFLHHRIPEPGNWKIKRNIFYSRLQWYLPGDLAGSLNRGRVQISEYHL